MAANVDISLILCTYNRADQLGSALESVLASRIPADRTWEVLLVDNNSRDQTREVGTKFSQSFPGKFRYVFEARQGLSNARNRGISEARGKVIAFTDDDVTVETAWLHRLTEPLLGGAWAGAGGRVRPPRGFVQPDWLVMDGGLMDSSGVLALFDAGGEPCELRRPPFGANMAFRKDIFERYGGFRPELGRCGDSLVGNEDTEFGLRLLEAGERLFYEPAAVVYHPVSEQRLNQKYFLQWWYAYGKALYRQSGPRAPVFGMDRAYFSLLSRTVRWLSSSPRNVHERFYWKCRLWVAAGELSERYNRRKRRSTLQES